jgi:hypothetical protein
MPKDIQQIIAEMATRQWDIRNEQVDHNQAIKVLEVEFAKIEAIKKILQGTK